MSKFEIGDWVTFDKYIGQILYVRDIFVEKYSSEYFSGAPQYKIGTYLCTNHIVKCLCDTKGKIKKQNRIFSASPLFPIKEKEKKVVEKIKEEAPEEYHKYVIYDTKTPYMAYNYLNFFVRKPDVQKVEEYLDEIKRDLPSSFTIKEFEEIVLDSPLSSYFSSAHKGNTGLEHYELIFFNPLNKIVNKEHIYSYVKGHYVTGTPIPKNITNYGDFLNELKA